VPEGLSETTEMIAGAVALVAGITVLIALGMNGVFRERTFDHAPRRVGPINLADLAMVLGLFMLGLAAAAGAVQLLPRLLGDDPAWSLAMQVILSPLAMIPAVACGGWVMHHRLHGGLSAWGIDPVSLRKALLRGPAAFILALPVVTLIAGLAYQVADWLGQPPPAVAHQTLRMLIDTRPDAPTLGVIALGVVVLAPLVEELLFRGIVQTTLAQPHVLGGRWRAILATSAVFAVIHLPAVEMAADAPEPPDKADAPPSAAERMQRPSPPVNRDAQRSAPPSASVSRDAQRSAPERPSPPVSRDAQRSAPQRTVANADPSPPDAPGLVIAWPSLVMLFALSVAMGLAYEKTGNLWVPVIMHLLFNAYNVAMALLLYT